MTPLFSAVQFTRINGQLQMRLGLEYFHQDLTVWEPVIEPWNCSLELGVNIFSTQHKKSRKVKVSAAFSSEATMNLNVTEMSLRMIGKAHAYLIHRGNSTNTKQSPLAGSVASFLWIKNDSGLDLLYHPESKSVSQGTQLQVDTLTPLGEDLTTGSSSTALHSNDRSIRISVDQYRLQGVVKQTFWKTRQNRHLCNSTKYLVLKENASENLANPSDDVAASLSCSPRMLVTCEDREGIKILHLASELEFLNLSLIDIGIHHYCERRDFEWKRALCISEPVPVPPLILQNSSLSFRIFPIKFISHLSSSMEFNVKVLDEHMVLLPERQTIEFKSRHHQETPLYISIRISRSETTKRQTVLLCPPLTISNFLSLAIDVKIHSSETEKEWKTRIVTGQSADCLALPPNETLTLKLVGADIFSTKDMIIPACTKLARTETKIPLTCIASQRKLILSVAVVHQNNMRSLSFSASAWVYNETDYDFDIVRTTRKQNFGILHHRNVELQDRVRSRQSPPLMLGDFDLQPHSGYEW
eukprot:CAMPEP_0117735554 /NCGR_PEP_ID=MMETSP0947-20121206/1379_1 /TAXON_ID=44440 /ORGANISM="Chattonella subsalsa, Strain CCMP2191" /LENGTH=527 /DNA_ID=CAMNT_0005550627 /DNA_START=373 /DNA_END=1953 /DNA_ORIENTATION=+